MNSVFAMSGSAQIGGATTTSKPPSRIPTNVSTTVDPTQNYVVTPGGVGPGGQGPLEPIASITVPQAKPGQKTGSIQVQAPLEGVTNTSLNFKTALGPNYIPNLGYPGTGIPDINIPAGYKSEGGGVYRKGGNTISFDFTDEALRPPTRK